MLEWRIEQATEVKKYADAGDDNFYQTADVNLILIG